MSGMIKVIHHGNFNNTERFLKGAEEFSIDAILNRYGQAGVQALSAATPVRTGTTAASWGYEIEKGKDQCIITWTNSNVHNGVNIALILQYGHGTGTGGYVQGRDYINPALRSVFDGLANDAWEEIVRR